VVELRQVGGDRLLVRNLAVDHVFRIEEGGDVEGFLGQAEGVCVVLPDVGRVQRVVVEEVGPEVVDDGVEGQAVPEGGAQVGDVDVWIIGRHLAAPNLERPQTFPLHRSHFQAVVYYY